MKPSNYGKIHTLTLPSGYKILARRPSVLSLISSGGFPSQMTQEVWKLIEKEKITVESVTESPEAIQQWAIMLNAYLPHVAVDPKIQPGVPTNIVEDDNKMLHGVLAVEDVQDLDKQFIFLFGNGVAASDEELAEKLKEAEAAGLTRFPVGSERVDGGRGSKEVRTEAVEASGNPVVVA